MVKQFVIDENLSLQRLVLEMLLHIKFLTLLRLWSQKESVYLDDDQYANYVESTLGFLNWAGARDTSDLRTRDVASIVSVNSWQCNV